MKRALFTIILFSLNLFALQPPRKGEIDKLKREGIYEKRLNFAKNLGNHILKVKKIEEKEFFGLPSKGSQKIFVLLVEFPDYRHTIDKNTIENSLFGNGVAGYFPYESLKNFYLRSSYGILNIEGDVYGWYKAKNKRSYYTDNAEALIKEVLAVYDNSVDFSQYDNDGDGTIDYFAVYWTGPDEGWASFWWGWNGVFADSSYKIDGRKLYNFTWQWEEEGAGTIIHETGHALGLPDYYDYDDSIGPKGGLGGMDVMDGVWGDHNGFSKWLLGWAEPIVIKEGVSNITLRPSASYQDFVVMGRDFDGSSPYGEYFLIQNRQLTGNDIFLPGSGFMIFHIDSRVGCEGNFLYDNSYTEHKLIRLMEADGKEEIEKGRWGDAGDFYTQGKSFTPLTFPSSHFYNGISSGVWVRDITFAANDGNANFVLSLLQPIQKPEINIQDRSFLSSDNLTVSWDNVEGNEGYEVEVRSGANPLTKTNLPKNLNYYKIPDFYVYEGSVLNLWVKTKADEENFSSSYFEKVHFVIDCENGIVFFKNTYDPPPCNSFLSALTYDFSSGKIVLFGGRESRATEEFDGEKWEIFETNPAPPRRWYTTSSYDPVNKGMLMFGGWDFVDNVPLGDTWFYDSENHKWEKKESLENPWPDWACKMATNFKENYILLYCPKSTYKWNGKEWNLVQGSNTPEIYYTDIAYISKLNGFILFGGYNASWAYNTKTYFFDGNRWKVLNTQNSPTGRGFHRLIRDPYEGGVYLFGGEYNWEYLADLWKFDGEDWEEILICSDLPFNLWPPMGDYFKKDGYFFFTNGSGSIFELVIPYQSKHQRPF